MPVIPGPLQVPEPINDEGEIIDRENSFIYKDVGSDGYRVFVSVVPTYPHTKRGRYRLPKNHNRKGMRQKGMRQKGMRQRGNLKQPGGSSCNQRR